MAMNDFGVTFNPASSMDQAQRGGSRDPNASVQQAVRTLSLRLPSVVGARSIAPAALLSGQGGVAGLSGMPQTQAQPFGLQQILQLLMGGQSLPGMGGGVGAGDLTPNIKFGNGDTPGAIGPEIGATDDPIYGKPPSMPGAIGPEIGSDTRLPNKFDPETRYSE